MKKGLGFLVASVFLFISQVADAQTFTATASGSDYYIYLRWTAANNACVSFPWTEYNIKREGTTTNIVGVVYNGTDVPAHQGTTHFHAAGPGQSFWYIADYRFKGAFLGIVNCDYGGTQRINGNTNSIRPPASVTATTDMFDTKVVVKWGASTTDVPTNKYQYRVYRDSALVATVTSSVLTWTDTNVVVGRTYKYEVESYAADWNNRSTRVSANGRAFSLNVRTESLASGVKITWNTENSDSLNFQKFTIERKDGNNSPEFLISINSPTATSWTDPNTGGLPLPGYTYTYIVTPDNNAGKTYRSGSATGFRLPNGSISGYVKAPFGGGVPGVNVVVTRQNSVPQGADRETYSSITDANGYYSVSQIYYYDDATFSITPELVNHGFRPVSETRSLTLSSYTHTNIDFIDTSSFTINCYVKQVFNGDTISVPGVEIWADNIPRGYVTDTNGFVAVTVSEIGTHSFKPVRSKHAFIPSDTSFYISDDVAELVFFDTTTRTFSGTFGGPCGIYIGKAQLHIFDKKGIIDTLIENDHTGNYSVILPAQPLIVRVNDFTQEGDIVTNDSVLAYFTDTLNIDLDTSEVIYPFIYRKKPVLSVTGFPRIGCGGTYNGKPIVEQAQPFNLELELRENFGTSNCLVDTGWAVITHTLNGGATVTDTVPLANGRISYEIVPGTPNIIAPHFYQLEVVAYTGNVSDYYSTQVLVTGNRPREQTFTSVSPNVPLMILRDPPGDGSYSYLSKNSSFNTSFKLYTKMESSVNLWSQIKLGAEYEAGQFIFTAFKVYGQLKNSLTIGGSLTNTTELSLKITASEKVSTSGNQDITGTSGDVFVGAAINMVYAITDVVEYDTSACGVEVSKQLIMSPNGFSTTFMYTDDHIRNVLIPQLREISELYETSHPDSAVLYQSQMSVWQQTLDRNDSLKKNALFIENRSFSAGVPYENSLEVTAGLTNTIDFSMYLEASLAAELGMEIGGSGASGGVESKLKLEMGGSSSIGSSYTRTTGYYLSDDDAGDFFSVDIMADLAYAAPVFKLVAGRSSCPWEPGTQPRDGVQLLSDTTTRLGVNSTDAALFTLSLGNTTQSGEIRTYNLRFLQESNPYGAVITLGGSQVQGGSPVPYTINPGSSVNATVTVRKGPSAWDYSGLKFVLASPCDGSISDDIELNVVFCDTCNVSTNRKPVITTTAIDSAIIGQPYLFQLSATDPDANQVMWYLIKAPNGMGVNVMTGALSFDPLDEHEGTDTVMVRATDGVLSDTATYLFIIKKEPTSIAHLERLPSELSFTAAPNPFNPTVNLRVGIPRENSYNTSIQIYSVAGKLLNGWILRGAGYHNIIWNGKQSNGEPLPTGLYIARLQSSGKTIQRKLLMLK